MKNQRISTIFYANMKNIASKVVLRSMIAMLFIASFSVHGQNKKDYFLYKSAYSYLIKTKEIREYSNISVSDSIIWLEYSLLFDKMKEGNNQSKNLKILDSLGKLDNNRKFVTHSYKLLRKNRFGSRGKRSIIFFSKPFKNTLLAEFFHSQKDISTNYNGQTLFGEGTLFLLYFDKKKHFIKYVSVNISYN